MVLPIYLTCDFICSMPPRRLSDTIAAALERRILEGALRPGDRLPSERELAAELGVSRPSLREAIQKLLSRGLLNSYQGGGTFVTEGLTSGFFSPWQHLLETRAEVRDNVLELRRALGTQAAEWAAARRSAADMALLQQRFACLDEKLKETAECAPAPGNALCLADLDTAFHQALFKAAQNVLLTHLGDTLLSLLRKATELYFMELGKIPRAYALLSAQYAALLESIHARRPVAARAAAAAHLDFAAESMAETMRAAFAVTPALSSASLSGSRKETRSKAAKTTKTFKQGFFPDCSSDDSS
jgi:GntR family transcriptional repressor for pyruvate dehydrogenase complex